MMTDNEFVKKFGKDMDLKFGTVLPNGATVIKADKYIAGRWPRWIVLAHFGGYHPWVIWTVDHKLNCDNGRYVEDLGAAVEEFKTRRDYAFETVTRV